MKRTAGVGLLLVAMAVVIARFPHAEDFATAYAALALFVSVPLLVAFALRNTRLWWCAGSATIAIAACGVLIAWMPYGTHDTVAPWLVICGLYAAFGTLLIRRTERPREHA